MGWQLILCLMFFLCTGIAQIEEVQKMENKAEAVAQDREQVSSKIVPENITLSGGHKAWKVKIPGNRPLATVAYEDGLIFFGWWLWQL